MALPRLRRWSIAGLLAVVLALVVAPGCARADGDPASDVLVSAPPLFLSSASGATFAQAQVLVHQLQAAARRGRPLRVAVIAERSDLGSVTALWGQPQTYAQFLGRELSLAYRGELLVVMPAGFGVARRGVSVGTALSRLAPRSGQLLDATEQAVQRLTGVAPGRAPATVLARSPARVGGPGWWAATGVAVALLLAAWAVSLRRRPARRLPGTLRRHPHRS